VVATTEIIIPAERSTFATLTPVTIIIIKIFRSVVAVEALRLFPSR
jgi:hypothetical protein